VKSLDMAWKLNRIAESMKGLETEGTTRIDWHCLTERERLLFDKITEIKERYWPQLPPDDVLKENHELFVKGIEIVARRTIDLFKEVMETAFFTTTQDEPIMDFIFTTRLYCFLHQMGRQDKRTRKEAELSEKYEKLEDFERAWKEYEEKLGDKTALWSPESFERFVHPLFEEVMNNSPNRANSCG